MKKKAAETTSEVRVALGCYTLGNTILTHITYKATGPLRHIYYLFPSFIADFGI